MLYYNSHHIASYLLVYLSFACSEQILECGAFLFDIYP